MVFNASIPRLFIFVFVSLLFLGNFKACNCWTSGRATFYGSWDGSGTLAGACGYGNIFKTGYGLMTGAASSAIWKRGLACGICLQLFCINTKTWKFCLKGSRRITVTVTNMCPQDWRKTIKQGAWCNNPAKHLDLSVQAFLKIAHYRGGVVPIAYRRVPCLKWGGIIIRMQGNPYWLEFNVQNVAGPGNLAAIWVRPKGSRFVRMVRNWGAVYSKAGRFLGRPLSFIMKSSYTNEFIYIPRAIPRHWRNGVYYRTNKQFSVARMKNMMRGRRMISFPEDFPEDFKQDFPNEFNEDSAENADFHKVSIAKNENHEKVSKDLSTNSQPHNSLKNTTETTDKGFERYRSGNKLFPSFDELNSWEQEVDEIIAKGLET